MSEAPLLEVEDLCVDYATDRGMVRAVEHVSFTVRAGEIFGLAGESGSGKSTVIQALLRLLKPPGVITGGHVHFDGKPVFDMDGPGLRALRWVDLSLVCQSAMNALNPVMTIGEQLGDALMAHEGLGRRAAIERGAALLDLVGIERARASAYPHELSGGMRQRVVIAMALGLEPRLVVMDEPTTALDVVVQREILAQIARLRQELGFAVLFITHDLSLMFQLSDRIGILYAGRLIEEAPSSTLFAGPRHPYTVGLMRSFPDLHGEGDQLEGVPGTPPDLRNPPSGCRFHPRCTRFEDACAEHEPSLVALAGSNESAHRAACYHPHDPNGAPP